MHLPLLPLPPEAPHHLLLAFSGGRDSSVLLHRLLALGAGTRRRLRAVHVDHGLHPDSADWAKQAIGRAEQLGIECVLHRVQVPRGKGGLEAAARKARWQALALERRGDECLVLAQHRDDQIETLLLALLRGSGERGLAAMRSYGEDPRGPCWRPLLDTPGSAIAAYAHAHALRWIDDPANQDLRHRRNLLRLRVLPLLRGTWPDLDTALAASAQRLAEADQLLAVQDEADLARLESGHEQSLDLIGLRELPLARRSRVLRAFTQRRGVALGSDPLARVLGPWAELPPGRAVRHALGDFWLQQWSNRLWLSPRPAPPPPLAQGHWDGRQALALPDGSRLRLLGCERLPTPLRVSARSEPGLRFVPGPGRRPVPPSKRLAALGVPPWLRDRVPLLCDAEGKVQALADLEIAPALSAWLEQRNARLHWDRDSELG